MASGYYGFGSAVEAFLTKHGQEKGLSQLRSMFEKWPLFSTLVSNMEMILAKTDIDIAARYATLVKDDKLRNSIFPRIVEEYENSCKHLLAITGQKALLEHNPVLRRVIASRLPHLDPLNHLQVEMLRRYRNSGQEATERVRRGIHTSINAIASVLRNGG
jgi:phosphoenolpyruvate carboxylase